MCLSNRLQFFLLMNLKAVITANTWLTFWSGLKPISFGNALCNWFTVTVTFPTFFSVFLYVPSNIHCEFVLG